MPRAHLIQTNFTAGELTPLMQGRVDVNKYGNGADTLTNFIVRQQGPLWRRSGTKFIGEVKTSAKKTIVREFTFSDAQEYVLEIGENYIRIWLNGGFVETAPASGVPLEVATPYVEADLIDLRFEQSADILYLVHPSYAPRQLERLGANSWVLNYFDNQDGPYLDTDTSDTNLIVDKGSSQAQAKASAALFGNITSAAITAAVSTTGLNGGLVKLTAPGHGLTVGASCVVSGLNLLVVETSHGILQKTSTRPADFNTGNGNYTVAAVSGNDVTLAGSWFLVTATQSNSYQYTWTYVLTGATIRAAGNSNQNWVDYRDGFTWRLAKILSVASTTSAIVSPQINEKDDVGSDVSFSISGTVMSADHSGVFTPDDVNKYVRDPQTHTWYHINSIISDSQANVSGILTIQYDYSVITVTVTNWTVTGRVRASAALFNINDIGRHIRFNFGGKQPWAKITTYVSTTEVAIIFPGHQAPVDPANGGLFGVTNLFRLGAWSATTGFPKTVVFHEQRIWFGGNNNEPQRMWSSQSADFTNFAPTLYDSTVTDACAITYTLSSSRANPILWMISGPTMLVGTLGAEYQVKASTLGQPLAPTNIMILPQTNHGSLSTCIPFRIGYAVLFVQRAGRKMIELTYEFTLDSYVSKDLTITSEHIFRQGGQAFRFAYQKEPGSMLWACLTDGTLACLTYEREQQVAAWHRHQIAGSNVKVESICSVSSQAGTEDVLYMVVNRTINGSVKRYIEAIQPDFFPSSPTNRTNMWFLDCAAAYSGSPATVISGLGFLNGEHVAVVADGAVLSGTFTPSGGSITLPKAASKVLVGYTYQSLLRVLPIEGGNPNGTAQGIIKRPSKVTLRLLSSLGFKYGSDLNNLVQESFRTIPTDPMDASPPFFSGDIAYNIPGEYTKSGQFYVEQSAPYPLIVLAVIPDVGTYGS